MLTRIITAAVALVLFGTVLFVLPEWAAVVVFALLAAVAAREILIGSIKEKGLQIISAIVCAAAFVPVSVYAPQWQGALMFALVVVNFFPACFNMRVGINGITRTFFAGIIIPWLLCSLLRIFMAYEHGALWLLIPCICAWMCDTMAYFTGRAIGKHKLAPDISPKKTIEGAVGGILGSVIGLCVYAFVLQKTVGAAPDYLLFAACGIVGSVLGQCGDLAMSMFKRERGIKDYGNLFPGHGGVLDRFDSLLLVGPFFEIMLNFTHII